MKRSRFKAYFPFGSGPIFNPIEALADEAKWCYLVSLYSLSKYGVDVLATEGCHE